MLGRCTGHTEAVTCCKLISRGAAGMGGGRGGDDAGSSAASPLLVSSTAGGEVRVWDLRGIPADPWGDESGDDSSGSSWAGAYTRLLSPQRKHLLRDTLGGFMDFQ